MTLPLLSSVLLLGGAAFGIVGLRRFSDPVRIAFEFVCFIAFTAFLLERGTSPLFAP